MRFVLALDQGTTSSRAILFDHGGNICGVAQREFKQIFPQSGWVEHDATEIWSSQLAVAREVLEKKRLKAADVAAIGIANQRETAIVWDRRTGQPIHNAIVWQDRRTAAICDELRNAGQTETIQQKTGLIIDPYFSGTKFGWILDQVPGARQRAERGELACGTVDSWLLWQLTSGKVHATDISNASRTMLLNIHDGRWDPKLLDLLRVPLAMLPEVRSCSEELAYSESEFFGGPILIGAMAGDQQAALFGQQCWRHGMAKNTYGTGCFMLMNVGETAQLSRNRLLTTVAWQRAVGNNQAIEYALEGSVFVAGAAVQWLRDGLGIIQTSSQVEPLAASVPDCGGVYLVPAFAGLGAPHWDAYARGTIVGLTRGTTAAHIARAALEGIAFQVADVLDAMQQDTSIPIAELRVDGGACVNNLLMQFQADVLQAPVVRPKVIETTALGAALMAGLTANYWSGLSDIAALAQTDRVFQPQLSTDEAQHRRSRWQSALQRSREWET